MKRTKMTLAISAFFATILYTAVPSFKNEVSTTSYGAGSKSTSGAASGMLTNRATFDLRYDGDIIENGFWSDQQSKDSSLEDELEKELATAAAKASSGSEDDGKDEGGKGVSLRDFFTWFKSFDSSGKNINYKAYNGMDIMNGDVGDFVVDFDDDEENLWEDEDDGDENDVEYIYYVEDEEEEDDEFGADLDNMYEMYDANGNFKEEMRDYAFNGNDDFSLSLAYLSRLQNGLRDGEEVGVKEGLDPEGFYGGYEVEYENEYLQAEEEEGEDNEEVEYEMVPEEDDDYEDVQVIYDEDDEQDYDFFPGEEKDQGQEDGEVEYDDDLEEKYDFILGGDEEYQEDKEEVELEGEGEYDDNLEEEYDFILGGDEEYQEDKEDVEFDGDDNENDAEIPAVISRKRRYLR